MKFFHGMLFSQILEGGVCISSSCYYLYIYIFNHIYIFMLYVFFEAGFCLYVIDCSSAFLKKTNHQWLTLEAGEHGVLNESTTTPSKQNDMVVFNVLVQTPKNLPPSHFHWAQIFRICAELFFKDPRVFHGDRPSATCPPWWNVWRQLRIKLAWLRTTGGNGGKKGKMIGKMMEGFSFLLRGVTLYVL